MSKNADIMLKEDVYMEMIVDLVIKDSDKFILWDMQNQYLILFVKNYKDIVSHHKKLKYNFN